MVRKSDTQKAVARKAAPFSVISYERLRDRDPARSSVETSSTYRANMARDVSADPTCLDRE
jgi:hypothetical protein